MRDEKTALDYCSFCPKLCRFSCPVAEAEEDEATTPWGKMSAMKLVDEGKLPMNRETMSLAYKCLNCRRSEEVCELDNPVSAVLDAHRARAFQAGLAPPSVHRYCSRFQKYNNPFPKDLRGELEARFPARLHPRRKKTYFPGCTEIATNPDGIERFFRLAGRLGVGDIGLFPESLQCCGYPLLVAGDWENFRETSEVMANVLRDYSLVVSGAPACLETIGRYYASAGFPARTRLMHTVEYLKPAVLEAQAPKRKKGPRVAYHDPCYLGRHRGVYDPPREILAKVDGRPPVEFFRNRQYSYCCGAGGLLPVSSPETADKITANRLAEFGRLGADRLITACPSCVRRFSEAGKKSALHLTDYLAELFGV